MVETATRSTTDGFQLKWTLATKVGGLAAVLLGLLLAIAGFNYRTLTQIGQEVSEIAEVDVPVVRLASQLQVQQLEQHLEVERVVSLGASIREGARAERDRVVAAFEGRSVAFDAAFAQYTKMVEQGALRTAEYQRLTTGFAPLQQARQAFLAVARQAMGTATTAKPEEWERLSGEAGRTGTEVERELARIHTETETFTEASVTAAASHELDAKNLSAGLSVAATVVAILLSIVFIKSLRKSVTSVTGMAVQIAEGNLRQEKLAIQSTDELGQLGVIVNGMLANLQDNVTQTRAAAGSLNAAVAEIVASVKEQAASTIEQAAAVQETTATMEEINQSGNQIADRSRQVAAAAEAASTATSQGMDAVLGGSKIMAAIQEQAETVAENIVSLSEKTQAVGEIIATVTDIAEQSNLLALNAAIEAAAAGEQGRSFAVVANEIKNLADQAKDATVRVRSILGDIQKGINSSVMLTEEVVKRVDSGKQQSDVVERTIRHMADSLNSSVQAFQQITAATGQQQIGFDQVTQALKNIRQASDQTAVSTNQLEKAATNLAGLGQQLSKSVERYRT